MIINFLIIIQDKIMNFDEYNALDKILWIVMFLKNKILSKVGMDFLKFYWIKNQKLDIKQASDYIIELLQSEQPCMIARLGACEMNTVAKVQKIQLGFTNTIPEAAIEQLCTCAGFFPNSKEDVIRFAELTVEAVKDLDLLGIWNVSAEEYTLSKWNKMTKVTKLENLEPWYLPEHAWSSALRGKKVLVIHPFAETIQQQYKKRTKIFPDYDILPAFDLITIKAVQTAAGEKDARFRNWFEALEYMFEEAMKIDFDVVILGCGAYGFPLASKFKRMGKKAIHLGGATQLMFGIKGKRWDENPFFQGMYNENWTRPSNIEKPKAANSVESGCYW